MKIKPSDKQIKFFNWELGVFFHFGIRTFYEGHKDWDMQPMPLENFNPAELDCEQWIRTIKAAGASYAILVTKHHDGFANWPSVYTDYSVVNTPWKNGKGDVVAEFIAACRKYGIKTGLYYSPAEFGMNECKRTDREYDDYFINQLSELLTNYGKIDYLWFDGCGSEGHTYDKKRIMAEIRRMQPDIMIFNMWDPDTRWIGNEDGMAPYPNFNTVEALDFSVLADVQEEIAERRFLPGECDCRMREINWFYSEKDADTVKTLDELMGLYYLSVGRGANLLINIGPDMRGLLPEPDCIRLQDFGNEIRRRFSKPVARFEPKEKKNGGCYEIKLPCKSLINHAVLEEDISQGESVKHFVIRIKTLSTKKWITVYEGKSIGHKTICQFPAVSTDEIAVDILEDEDGHSLKGISLYCIE